jgi:diacylglycerol kinase (ATP)
MKRNTGFKRIIFALGYSAKGLRAAFSHEAAFRQELLLACVLTPIAFLLDIEPLQRLLLTAVLLLVLIVELLNSAIEAVVDRIGPEHHELSGHAKDLGSAAVLLSLLLAVATWGTVLWPLLLSS